MSAPTDPTVMLLRSFCLTSRSPSRSMSPRLTLAEVSPFSSNNFTRSKLRASADQAGHAVMKSKIIAADEKDGRRTEPEEGKREESVMPETGHTRHLRSFQRAHSNGGRSGAYIATAPLGFHALNEDSVRSALA